MSRNHQSSERESRITAMKSAARKREVRDIILFCLCGVGATLGTTSVLSSLVYYSSTYGEDSFLYLNVAVFSPLLPMSILQSLADDEMDKKYTSRTAVLFRGSVALSVATLMILLVPYTTNLGQLCGVSVVLGTAAIVMQNMLLQVASFVSSDAKISMRIKAYVTMGLQASAVLTLLTSLLYGFGSSDDDGGELAFYATIAGLELLVLMGFWYLMYDSPMVHTGLIRRDSSFVNLEEALFEYNEEDAEEGLETQTEGLVGYESRGGRPSVVSGLPGIDDSIRSTGTNYTQTSVASTTYRTLIYQTYPILLSLIVTVSTSCAVAAWFTHVQSATTYLPQLLFYTRLAFDLLGRPATLIPCFQLRSSFAVSMLAIPRALCFVPLFFMSASEEDYWLLGTGMNDGLLVCLVAGLSFSSGYINTACYQIAPSMVENSGGGGGNGVNGELSEEIAGKQASLINIAFAFAVVLGVYSSLLFGSVL